MILLSNISLDSYSNVRVRLTICAMAFRTATACLRSNMVGRSVGSIRPFASSTAPRMKPATHVADSVHVDHHPKANLYEKLKANGETAPLAMVMGMVVVAMSIGAHTAKQQLVHSPGVRVNKKKRETFPEVEQPDGVVNSASKFVNKSFFRKVAHIQDRNPVLPDSTRPTNPFTMPRQVETLESVGVDPRHS